MTSQVAMPTSCPSWCAQHDVDDLPDWPRTVWHRLRIGEVATPTSTARVELESYETAAERLPVTIRLTSEGDFEWSADEARAVARLLLVAADELERVTR